MTKRFEGIEDNHITVVKMHAPHDRATYWINNKYWTGIPRHIDRSNMHFDAHIVALLWTAICIALDMNQRIVSTIPIAGLVRKILVYQYLLKQQPRMIYVLPPQGRVYWSLQYALWDHCAKYCLKRIVLHIVLSKVWNTFMSYMQNYMTVVSSRSAASLSHHFKHLYMFLATRRKPKRFGMRQTSIIT